MKTIIANYILWPGAHFINFRFVPSEHRILCVTGPLLSVGLQFWRVVAICGYHAVP